MKRIDTIYSSSWDWVALYVDGRLRYEGHSIPDSVWKDLFREMGVEVGASIERGKQWFYGDHEHYDHTASYTPPEGDNDWDSD